MSNKKPLTIEDKIRKHNNLDYSGIDKFEDTEDYNKNVPLKYMDLYFSSDRSMDRYIIKKVKEIASDLCFEFHEDKVLKQKVKEDLVYLYKHHESVCILFYEFTYRLTVNIEFKLYAYIFTTEIPI